MDADSSDEQAPGALAREQLYPQASGGITTVVGRDGRHLLSLRDVPARRHPFVRRRRLHCRSRQPQRAEDTELTVTTRHLVGDRADANEAGNRLLRQPFPGAVLELSAERLGARSDPPCVSDSQEPYVDFSPRDTLCPLFLVIFGECLSVVGPGGRSWQPF